MLHNDLELLAPAGTWDVLEAVSYAGADAVYIGGKKFNMRLLKGDYNFSEKQIQKAVQFLHSVDKKLYITINNLFFENETEDIKNYLLFLQNANVDALIVQDLSIVKLHQELNLTIPLHASVQMGIGNSEAVKFFEKQGFSRVILSKNLSLNEISEISKTTTMGIEFFAHGDLCISHTGQCYMSSFIAGASGNRGRCIKPCRWQYKLSDNDSKGYYLAHNDLSLYPYLTELVNAGVTSFKIEGRMRQADYLSTIVGIYRKAIDRILTDKEDYKIDQSELNKLDNVKVRNVTAAGLWGDLGSEAVDISGEREPFFPTKQRKLETLSYKNFENHLPKNNTNKYKFDELSIKVGNRNIIKEIKDYCDTIIIGLEQFPEDNSGFNFSEIRELLEDIPDDVQIKVETPRIVTQKNWKQIEDLIELHKYTKLTGFIVNDLGSLRFLANHGFSVWGGPGLNVTNSKASQFLMSEGAKGICLSLELKMDNLKKLDSLNKNLEIMVHGPLVGIITDYDVVKYNCSSYDSRKDKSLIDDFNQRYKLRFDKEGRTYIYYPYDLCLFNYLPHFIEMGITRIRIDGQFLNKKVLMTLAKIYHQRLEAISNGLALDENSVLELLALFDDRLTDLSFTRINV